MDKIKLTTMLLNEFKSKEQTFSKSDFNEYATKCSLAYRQLLLNKLMQHGIIQRLSHGQYMWIGSEPIFIGKISIIFDELRTYFLDHKYQASTSSDNKEQEAIAYLKRLGYKVMKPVNDFVEV